MKICIMLMSVVILLAGSTTNGAEGTMFDVGNRQSGMESSNLSMNGYRYYLFDSNCSVMTHSGFVNNVSSIFDGDANTSLEFDSGGQFASVAVYLHFPLPFYIDNITVNKTHMGNSSQYSLGLTYGTHHHHTNFKKTPTHTYEVHNFITEISLTLEPYQGTKYYFGDVFFNYTPVAGTPSNMQAAINVLFSQIGLLKGSIGNISGMVDNITVRLDALEGYVSDLKDFIQTINQTVSGLNFTLEGLNQTLQSILENLTGILSMYEAMELSMGQLGGEVAEMNATFQDTFLDVEADLAALGNNIQAAQSSIGNLETNTSVLPQVLVDIDNIMTNITILSQDLTQLADLIPEAYDDSALESRISALETDAGDVNVTSLEDRIEDLEAGVAALEEENGGLSDEVESVYYHVGTLEGDIDNLTEESASMDQQSGENSVDDKEGGTHDDTGLWLITIVALIIGTIGMLFGVASLYRFRKASLRPDSEDDKIDGQTSPPDTPPSVEKDETGAVY